MLSFSPVGIGLSRGRTLLWGPDTVAMHRMLGYRAGELYQKDARVLYPDQEEYQRVGSALFPAVWEQEKVEVETRWIRKDGSVFPCRVRMAALHGDPNREMAVCLAEDMSVRKQAEDNLARAEARHRTLLEQIPATVYVAKRNPSSATVYVSPKIKELTGYPAEDFQRDPSLWARLLHHEDKEKILAQVADSHAHGNPWDLEYRMHDADGGIVWVRDLANPLLDQAGRPVAMQGVIHDITGPKEQDLAFKTLVRTVSGQTGQAFFNTLVRQVAEWLGSDIALVSEIEADGQVRVLAMQKNGEAVFDYDCDLERTACGCVAEQGYCYVPDQATGRFPDDVSLRQLGVRGFVGCKLRDDDGNPMGILCAMSRGHLALPKRAEEVLKILADRAAAEISRRRLDAALLAGHERTKGILEHSPSLIFLKDDQGRFTLINREFEKVHNLNRARVLGCSHWQVFPPEVAGVFDKTDREVLERQAPLTDLEVLSLDGVKRSFVTTKFPILGPDGRKTGLGGISTEVTEQLRVSQSLAKTEQFNHTIIESSRDCIMVLDLDGGMVFINLEGLRQLGEPRLEALEGMPFADLWQGEYRERALAALGLAGQGEVGEFQGRGDGLKGRFIWWEVVISPIRDSGGRVERLLAVSRDITDRKRDEEELARHRHNLEEMVAERTKDLDSANRLLREEVEQRRYTEQRLRNSEQTALALLNSAQETSMLVDLSGKILAINQAGAASLGLAPAEMVGCPVRDYFAGTAFDGRRTQAAKAVKTGQPVRFEDQEAGVINDITVYPVTDQDGQVEKLAIFARDVTAQRRAERTLFESEKFLRSVLNALSAEVVILDAKGVVLETNRAWHEFALANGMSRPTCVGINYLDVCDRAKGRGADYAARAAAGIRGVLQGEVDDFVMTYPCHSGDEKRWFLMRVKFMGGLGPAALVISHENISNIMMAEQALRESEERLARAVEFSPFPIMIHAQGGEVLSLSKSWSKLSGYSLSEIPTVYIWAFKAHRNQSEQTGKFIAGLYDVDGPTKGSDFEITCKDGSKRIWHFSSAPVGVLRDGRRLVSSMAMDVTEARAAVEEVKILARFPDENPNPVIRVGGDGRVQYLNQAARCIFGENCAQDQFELPGFFLSKLEPVLASGQSGQFSLEVSGRSYIFTSSTLADSGSVYLYGLDVSERRALERQQRLAARVFDNSVEGIIIADSTGTVQMVNPAFSAITGFPPEAAVGRTMDILRSENHDPQLLEKVWDGLTNQGQWSGEYINRRQNGEAYPEWLTVNLLKDAEGRPSNYIAIFHDITEIKRSQEQIRYQAHHDALTGLPNRALFADRLSQSITQAARHGSKLALLFLDLDNFKHINDSLGHDFGDELLQQVAKRLTARVRKADTVARLGGDEFILILNELADENGAVQVAGNLLKDLETPVVVRGQSLNVGASIGITMYPDDANDAETLLKYADMAMYRAKEHGRNNYQLFTPTMNQAATERLNLENRLRAALDRDQFVLHYQPRLDLASGGIIGVEALLRWNLPEGGLGMPGQFIGVAEESGLIVPIGRWVVHQACRQARAWLDQGPNPLRVSVNISARQFAQSGLEEMISGALRETGLPPDLLELEITETTMMRDVKQAAKTLEQIARLGVTFSVDDFGTGYSSLYYLKHLPIDALKIDYTFVRDIESDRNDAAIVETIISMGHNMNLLVVAEGVETQGQLDFLRQKGCDQVQGFHIRRPQPPAQLAEIFSRKWF